MDQLSNHPLYKKHNLDSVMNTLWEFYSKNFWVLFIVSAGMSLFIQYFSSMIDMKDIQQTTDPLVMLEKMKGYVVPFSVVMLINLLFSTILQHYIIFKPIDSNITIISSFYKSLYYFIPYLIIMVLLAAFGIIAMILGILMLVIGMFFALIYVMALYMFILPLMMVEGMNIGNVIKRAFQLTHRNFWPNMGWISVFLIILIVISVILSGIILIPFTGSFLKTLFNPEEATAVFDMAKNPVFMILSALANGLTFPLMPIFAAILYFNGIARENQKTEVSVVSGEPERVRVEDLYAKPYSDDHPDNPETK